MGFFRQPAAGVWVALLLLLFPFAGAGWVYLKPLMLDLGMPAEQVAWWVGVGGGTVGALAVPLLAGMALDRLGYSGMFSVLALCMLAVAALVGPGSKWLEAGGSALAVFPPQAVAQVYSGGDA